MRFPLELFPENIQSFMRFREACENVEHRNNFLQRLQPNEEEAIKLNKEVDEALNDIKRTLEVKRDAAQWANEPFDLQNSDWEEFCDILEDLDNRANLLISGRGRVTEMDAETLNSGIEETDTAPSSGRQSSTEGVTTEWIERHFPTGHLDELREVMKKVIETLSGLGSITSSGFLRTNRGPPSGDFYKAMSQLDKQTKKFEEARVFIAEFRRCYSDNKVLRVLHDSLSRQEDECNTKIEEMRGKLGQFQRTVQKYSLDTNGESSPTHTWFHSTLLPPADIEELERVFEVESGPAVHKVTSNLANLYLSYALDQSNLMYILFEEHNDQNTKQVICQFEICEGNTVEFRSRKEWPETRTLSKIAISDGEFFGATKEEGQNGAIEKLDIQSLTCLDRNPIFPAIEYDRVEHFLLVGTPDKLITMECMEQHQNLFSMFEHGRQLVQQSANIPTDMQAFRSFYHGDYLFHAGEQSNDLVAVRMIEQGELLEEFRVYNLKLEYMNSVHGFVGVDKGTQTYIVAIQEDNLSRLMIYKLKLPLFNEETAPSLQLVQVEDLSFKVMALIRTANRDKIVFLTIEERIGILDLKLL